MSSVPPTLAPVPTQTQAALVWPMLHRLACQPDRDVALAPVASALLGWVASPAPTAWLDEFAPALVGIEAIGLLTLWIRHVEQQATPAARQASPYLRQRRQALWERYALNEAADDAPQALSRWISSAGRQTW